jgi:beta-phosphoglucomutase
MGTIKAIIFDMDGVLVEAKDWHYEALNKALALFGMEISHYDHLVTYDGLPTKRKLEMLSQERGLPRHLHEFLNRLKQSNTMQLVHANCKPSFVHEYALSRLKKEGFHLALASNSIRDTVRIMMEKTCLAKHLDFSLSSEDVSKGKPDAEIYRKAIRKLELKPKECMIIEDNENGKKAARSSGAYLMEVNEVNEVNYANIMYYIKKYEETGLD